MLLSKVFSYFKESGKRVFFAIFKKTNPVWDRFSLLLTFIIGQFLILSNFSIANAQEEETITIDSIEQYQLSEDGAYVSNGDSNSNIEVLQGDKTIADMSIGIRTLYGTDVYQGASARADEVDYPVVLRQGLVNTVDNQVYALLVDPPAVNLPNHLANQWVPGYDQTGDQVVYAQGDGYLFLKNDIGLEPVWEMFRNIAYASFVLVLIAAGFMIMFRQKINGQTAVSIVNTIPGVIVGLILVTFSFAIVGFIIDIARLLTGIIGVYMQNNLATRIPGFEIVGFTGPIRMAGYAFEAANPDKPSAGGMFSVGSLSLTFIKTFLPTGVIFYLAILALALVCLYAAIRLYGTLVTTYFKLFIDLILGPIYILVGSLPGGSGGIVNWLKRVATNALTFPVAFFIINLGRYIAYSSITTGATAPLVFMSGGYQTPSMIQIRGVFVIAAYFLAAGAPAIVQSFLQAEEDKGIMSATENAKKAASQIPVIGGLLG
ncbi:hypothetical protein JW887_06790 [Candidatus Dojkabacteria bacterium]|nr:hypothetical protein [Candidatus Dojkabacteria bacterium]